MRAGPLNRYRVHFVVSNAARSQGEIHDMSGNRSIFGTPGNDVVANGDDGFPELSVVVPVYRNRETVESLYFALCRVLDRARLHWELVFVNDCCPDGSAVVLRRIARRDRRVRVLELSENVGQPRAVAAGLRVVRARYVVVMDADLQDPPEAIPRLLAVLKASRCHLDAVFAGHRGRFEPWARWVTGKLFRAFRGWLCSIPRDAGSFGVLKADVIPTLLSYDALTPHWPVLLGCAGFRSRSVPVERRRRPVGRSAYSFRARLKLAAELVRTALELKRRRRVNTQSVSFANAVSLENPENGTAAVRPAA